MRLRESGSRQHSSLMWYWTPSFRPTYADANATVKRSTAIIASEGSESDRDFIRVSETSAGCVPTPQIPLTNYVGSSLFRGHRRRQQLHLTGCLKPSVITLGSEPGTRARDGIKWCLGNVCKISEIRCVRLTHGF